MKAVDYQTFPPSRGVGVAPGPQKWGFLMLLFQAGCSPRTVKLGRQTDGSRQGLLFRRLHYGALRDLGYSLWSHLGLGSLSAKTLKLQLFAFPGTSTQATEQMSA